MIRLDCMADSMFVDIWLSWQQFWPLKRKSATRGQPYGLKPLEVGYRIHFLTYFCDFFHHYFRKCKWIPSFCKNRSDKNKWTNNNTEYIPIFLGKFKEKLFMSENRSDFIVAKNEWRNVRNLQYQFHPFFSWKWKGNLFWSKIKVILFSPKWVKPVDHALHKEGRSYSDETILQVVELNKDESRKLHSTASMSATISKHHSNLQLYCSSLVFDTMNGNLAVSQSRDC